MLYLACQIYDSINYPSESNLKLSVRVYSGRSLNRGEQYRGSFFLAGIHAYDVAEGKPVLAAGKGTKGFGIQGFLFRGIPEGGHGHDAPAFGQMQVAFELLLAEGGQPAASDSVAPGGEDHLLERDGGIHEIVVLMVDTHVAGAVRAGDYQAGHFADKEVGKSDQAAVEGQLFDAGIVGENEVAPRLPVLGGWGEAPGFQNLFEDLFRDGVGQEVAHAGAAGDKFYYFHRSSTYLIKNISRAAPGVKP